MLAVVLVSLIGSVVFTSTASGQAFPGAPKDRATNVRIYPEDIWGFRVGPGVGVGVVEHNLARRYDQWLVTAAPALHEQAATLAFASADPERAKRYVLVDARGLHSDRDWYGSPDERITLRRTSLRARLRVGQTLGNGRFLVQPHTSLITHNVTDTQIPSTLRLGSFIGDAGSIPEGSRTGIRAGVDLQFDTRPRPDDDEIGIRLQTTWDRYHPLDGTRLRFDQIDTEVYGFLGLAGRHRLVLRTGATLTEVRTDSQVPIYMLPALGTAEIPGWARRRFVGQDRLFGSLMYRFPIWQWGDALVAEGHIAGHLGSVYDDVGDQFSASVRFDEMVPSNIDPPLRPAASIGLRLATPLRADTELDFAVGVSPEGLSAVEFSVVRSLQSLRLPHHTTATIR